MAGGKLEEILRRALAAARRDLDAMRQVAEKQRQRAEARARDLTMVLQIVEELEAKAAGAMRSKAAALRARDAAEAALADERRALEEVRQKLGAYERDLALARQSSAAAEPGADLAAAEKAAVLARQVAEAAAKRAGEELALERERARSLARDLDTARRERDTAMRAMQQRAMEDGRDLAHALQSAAVPKPDANLAAAEMAAAVLARRNAEAAARRAGEELASERERAKSLARDLDSVRRELDSAMRATQRRAVEDGRDLADALQSAAVPEPDANFAAAEKAAAVLAGQIAEAEARRAGEELALEREKARSLARELDTVRRERDVAKKQLTRVLAAQRRASDAARDRGGGRERAATPEEIDGRKPATERRKVDVQPVPKALPDSLFPRRLVPGLW
jgi:hypothetical protein